MSSSAKITSLHVPNVADFAVCFPMGKSDHSSLLLKLHIKQPAQSFMIRTEILEKRGVNWSALTDDLCGISSVTLSN